MMKGRIVFVFWLVVVLAVLSATASYAWLAMNVSGSVRGIEVGAEADSVFLEISAERDTGYDKEVKFQRVLYSSETGELELSLVTNGYLPAEGAITLDYEEITEGKYDGTGVYYAAKESDITEGRDSYHDVTDTLYIGQSLIGLYQVREGTTHPVSDDSDVNYYYRHVLPGGRINYVCIGTVPEGETLSGRMYWGYSYADSLDVSQGGNTLNVVSLDTPSRDYALKNTVYLRCAPFTEDARDLRIDSVEINGLRNYLTDTIRIMFVVTSSDDETESKILFYNHRHPGEFEGALLDTLTGNGKETVRVDMYVYFDGTDDAAYKQEGLLTRNDVYVNFSVGDLEYN